MHTPSATTGISSLASTWPAAAGPGVARSSTPWGRRPSPGPCRPRAGTHDRYDRVFVSSDGSPSRPYASPGTRLAIRAEVGWLLLPRLPQERFGRAPVQVGTVPHP